MGQFIVGEKVVCQGKSLALIFSILARKLFGVFSGSLGKTLVLSSNLRLVALT